MSTPSLPTVPTTSTTTASVADLNIWFELARVNLQAQGLNLNDASLKGVAKGLARMAQVEHLTLEEAHRDFNLTLQQVRHV